MESTKTRELIQTSQLKINPATNTRSFRPRALRIAARFSYDLLGDLDVAPLEEGVFEVIDGGTRLIAARQLKVKSLWCQVHWDADTEEKRAALFIDLNGERTSIRAIDQFKAMVTKGDPDAVAVCHVLQNHGLFVGPHAKQPQSVSCTRVLLQAYRWGTLNDALSIIMESAATDSDARGGLFILGLAGLLASHDLKRTRLVNHLSSTKPSALLRQARDAASVKGGGTAKNLSEVLLDSYNKGLRADLKIQFSGVPRQNYVAPGGNTFKASGGAPVLNGRHLYASGGGTK